jgi:uncharacterized protein (DUF488 family)
MAQNTPKAPQPRGRLVGFGCAGLDGASGLRKLLGDEVDIVIDVRINRWSSTFPAFSTTTTQATVEAAGYAYRWLPGLGNLGQRDGGEMRLADPGQVEVVVDELRAGRNVGVMCVCRDGRRCHRRLVVELARQRFNPG